MTFALPGPLRVATMALGITATGLFATPIDAAPPTAFRVSPRVMQRLRGTPPPVLDDSADEPHAAATVPKPPAAPAEPTAPADSKTPVTTPPPPIEPAVPPALEMPTVPAAPRMPAVAGAAKGGDDWAPADGAAERPWRWIVIHHTATDAGSVAAIDRSHRRRRDASGTPWRGIGYHFLIGNGDGMGDGAVEATFRWRDQLAGAHAGRRAENDRGIGVCLVGDFEANDPSAAQLDAARRLIAFLRDRYEIPADRVLPHDAVSATACPGERLTVAMLLAPSAEPAGSPALALPTPAEALPSAGPVADWGGSDGDADEDYLPTGLSAPEAPVGPSLAAPAFPETNAPGASPSRTVAPRTSMSPPRFRSQDAP